MVEFAPIQTGGRYFKPGDHATDVALLVEPKEFEADRPGKKYGPKDAIHADVTYFGSHNELDEGKGVEEYGTIIQGVALVRDLKPLIGKATVAVITKVPTDNGSAWVWRQPSQDVIEKVVAYAKERDAALEAAKDEMPDFMK